MFEQIRTPAPSEPVKTEAGRRARLAGLEGPRGVACMAVLMVHVAVNFSPGVLAAARLDFLAQGLTFFFVLSGFLLYMPYVKRLLSGSKRPPTLPYFKHRILRVFPAYLLIFLIANYVMRAVYLEDAYTAGWSNRGAGTGMMTNPLDLLANLTLTHALFPATLQTGINPSWSLTTEYGFYLALPVIGVILFALARKGRRPLRAAAWLPILLLVLAVVVNIMVEVLQKKYYPNAVLEAYWGPNWIAVLSRSFFAMGDCFALGMLAAVIYLALANGAVKRISTFRLQLLVGMLVMIGVVVTMLFFWLEPRYVQTAAAFVSAAIILFITTPAARSEHSAVASITDWAPIRYLGTISLSVYLWHYPVLVVVRRLDLPIPSHAGGLMIAFTLVAAIAVGLGSITYRFVELPAMRLR